MRIKITPEDERCQYIVDKEKRKVVCVIHDTRRLLYDFIYDYDDCLGDTINFYVMIMPNQFSGVATCAEGDEWNEELGRKIAFNKAKEKLNNAFFKRAKTYVNEVDNEFNQLIGVINNYGVRLALDADKRGEEIDSLLGKKE